MEEVGFQGCLGKSSWGLIGAQARQATAPPHRVVLAFAADE
jgi:hypothetical protein